MPPAPNDSRPDAGHPAAVPPVSFEQVFEHLPMAASLTRRADGLILAVNRAWERLSGLGRDQVVGRTTVELGLWSQDADRRQYLDSLQEDVEPRCATVIGGKVRHVRMRTSVLPGDEPLLLVLLQDIDREAEAEQERDRSQAELRAANLRLQQQVELYGEVEKLAQVGYWTNAASEDQVIWSAGLSELAGLPIQGAVTRREGRSGLHPDDRAAWLAAREAMDGRVVEYRWQRPDNGQWIWLRTRMGQTAVAGNPQTDFGVVQDITQQKEAVRVQTEQLHLLQSITARVPGVVFLGRVPVRGWGSFEFVSETVRDLMGLEPAQLYQDGRTLFSRVHPDDGLIMGQSIWECTVQRKLWRQLFRVNHPSKGLRWFSAEGLPQTQPDGSVLWHGYVHDVTEARQAAQAIERQHRMLDAVRQAQAAYIEADDKRQAFEGLLKAFLSVTDSAYGFVGEVLYDSRGQPYLKTQAITDISWDPVSRRMYLEQMDRGMEFHNLQTLFGHALATGQTVLSNDPASDPRRGGMPRGHPAMTAFLGVPLAVGDRLIAMVGLANAPGGYRKADVEFLQPLLGTVRQLVLARRAHAERQRSSDQLQATGALLADKTDALQLTLDSISQGLAKVGSDGRVTIYNRRLLELLDLPDELLSSQPTQDEIVRFQAERGDFGVDYSLVEPSARDYVGLRDRPPPERYWRRTREGRTLEIRTRDLPEGGMVRTYTDVSSYVTAQEQLKEEQQRLAWVLEATRPGIWELDVVSGHLTINDRWAEMLGHTIEQLKPLNFETWHSRLHPQDVAGVIRELERHLAGETDYYECDIRMRHALGHWVWINTRGRVHRRDDQGRPLYMSGTHIDISERVLAQEEVRALNATLEQRVLDRTSALERSMRDMEVISYSIAHDLRAPLRSVNGFASLVREIDGDHLSAEGRLMFERIVSASRNMGQMITDMLELLRVVRVEIEPESVDMTTLARSVIEALAPAVPNAQVQLQPLPRVLGDAKLLRQLLSNLIDNALKYSRHLEAPQIELGFDATRAAFYLRDNGMGFDMAHAHKLFGLFQRLHAGASAPGGTGVGLAIVARTLERHGGRIWAEAQPGRGATFWWTLPTA
jgi:PAS domain S-box-containing protein